MTHGSFAQKFRVTYVYTFLTSTDSANNYYYTATKPHREVVKVDSLVYKCVTTPKTVVYMLSPVYN